MILLIFYRLRILESRHLDTITTRSLPFPGHLLRKLPLLMINNLHVPLELLLIQRHTVPHLLVINTLESEVVLRS